MNEWMFNDTPAQKNRSAIGCRKKVMIKMETQTYSYEECTSYLKTEPHNTVKRLYLYKMKLRNIYRIT